MVSYACRLTGHCANKYSAILLLCNPKKNEIKFIHNQIRDPRIVNYINFVLVYNMADFYFN